jgi:hypothetical protein
MIKCQRKMFYHRHRPSSVPVSDLKVYLEFQDTNKGISQSVLCPRTSKNTSEARAVRTACGGIVEGAPESCSPSIPHSQRARKSQGPEVMKLLPMRNEDIDALVPGDSEDRRRALLDWKAGSYCVTDTMQVCYGKSNIDDSDIVLFN